VLRQARAALPSRQAKKEDQLYVYSEDKRSLIKDKVLKVCSVVSVTQTTSSKTVS